MRVTLNDVRDGRIYVEIWNGRKAEYLTVDTFELVDRRKGPAALDPDPIIADPAEWLASLEGTR